jgi:hypothetical protein
LLFEILKYVVFVAYRLRRSFFVTVFSKSLIVSATNVGVKHPCTHA